MLETAGIAFGVAMALVFGAVPVIGKKEKDKAAAYPFGHPMVGNVEPAKRADGADTWIVRIKVADEKVRRIVEVPGEIERRAAFGKHVDPFLATTLVPNKVVWEDGRLTPWHRLIAFCAANEVTFAEGIEILLPTFQVEVSSCRQRATWNTETKKEEPKKEEPKKESDAERKNRLATMRADLEKRAKVLAERIAARRSEGNTEGETPKE